MDTDDQSEEMADHFCALYKDPQTRVSSIMVKVNALDPADRGAVTRLDLGDAVSVSWTPGGVGDPLEQTLVIEGIEDQVDQSGLHVRWLHTSPASQLAVFILDDPVYGLLDADNRLAF